MSILTAAILIFFAISVIAFAYFARGKAFEDRVQKEVERRTGAGTEFASQIIYHPDQFPGE